MEINDELTRIRIEQIEKYIHDNNINVLDSDLMYELYILKDFTLGKIAKLLNVNEDKLGIKLRQFGIIKPYKKDLLTRDMLHHLYIDCDMSIKDIAEYLKMSRTTVQTALVKFGFNEMKTMRLMENDVFCNEILNNKLTLKELSKKYSVDTRTLNGYLTKNKLNEQYKEIHKIGKYRDTSNLTKEELEGYRKQGKTYEEIAKINNTSNGEVRRLLHRYKIEYPKIASLTGSYEENKKTVEGLLRDGIKGRALDAKLGVGKGASTYLYEYFDIDPKYFNIDISKEEIKRVYIDEGNTLERCAEILGISRSRINQYINEYGLSKKTNIDAKRQAQLDNFEIIKKMASDGCSDLEIGNKLNMSSENVMRWRLKAGIGCIVRTPEYLELDAGQIDSIKEMCSKYYNLTQIANELDVARDIVKYHTDKIGLTDSLPSERFDLSIELGRLRKILPKEELKRLKLRGGQTASIAKAFNTKIHIISKLSNEYDLSDVRGEWSTEQKDIPYDTLYKLYIIDKMSINNIAIELEVSNKTVARIMAKYLIPLRPGFGDMVGYNQLRYMIEEENKTDADIAKIYNVTRGIVATARRKYFGNITEKTKIKGGTDNYIIYLHRVKGLDVLDIQQKLNLNSGYVSKLLRDTDIEITKQDVFDEVILKNQTLEGVAKKYGVKLEGIQKIYDENKLDLLKR